MKVTEITVQQTKQIRQFEPRVISMTVEMQDNDHTDQVIDDLVKYIEYKLAKPERDAKYDKFKATAEDEEASEKDRKGAQGWLEKYRALEEEIAALKWAI